MLFVVLQVLSVILSDQLGLENPEIGVECLPVEGIFLVECWSKSVEQLPEHSRFYSDKVIEDNRVLHLKFTHQSLILPIKCLPLQPQPHPSSPSLTCPTPLVDVNG